MEKQKKGRRRRGSRLLKLFVVSSTIVTMIVTRGMGTFPPNPISFLLRDLVAETLPPWVTASINTQLVTIDALPLPITDGVVDVFADKDALSKANSNSQAEMVSTSQAIAAATVAAQQTTTANQIAQVNASNAATVSAQQTAAAQTAIAQGTPNPATVSAQQTSAAQTAIAQGTPNPATVSAQQTSAAQTAIAQGAINAATISAQQTSAAQTAIAQGTPNPATVSAQQTSAAQTAIAQGAINAATVSAQQTSAAQTPIAQGTPNPATVSAQQTSAAQTAIAQSAVNAATVSAQQTSAAQTAVAQGTPNPATVSAQQTSAAQTAIARNSTATAAAQQTAAAITPGSNSGGGGEEESSSEGREKTATPAPPVPTETGTPQPTATATPKTTATTAPTATNTPQPTVTNTPLPSTSLGQVGQPQHGQLIIGTTTLQYIPPPDFYGLDSFTYTVKGAASARLSARQISPIELNLLEDSPPVDVPIPPNPTTTDIIITVNVNISNANDNPQAIADAFTLPENTATNLNVLANDTYLPDPIETLTIINLTSPAHGVVITSGTQLRYTPTLDYAGPDNFNYTISDGNGGTALTTVTITITNSNNPPLFVSAPILTATQGVSYSYVVQADDPDLLYGDSVVVSLVSQPSWLSLNGTTLTGLPTASDIATSTVTLMATDQAGLTATQTFDLMVMNVNDAPTFVSTPLLTATQDLTYSYAISTTDLDLPYGDSVTLTVITAPSWLNLSNGALSGIPTNNDVATSTVTLMVTDLASLTATQAFSLAVNNVNDPPTNTVPFTQTMLDHETLVFAPAYSNTISVMDIDAGNIPLTITFSITEGILTLSQTPHLVAVTGNGSGTVIFSGLLADLNTALQTLSYNPPINSNGLFQLTMTTVDGGQPMLSDTDVIPIIVQQVNAAPQWTTPLTATLLQNTPLVFSQGLRISLGDLDAVAGNLQVTMSITTGALSLAQVNGLTFSQGDGMNDSQISFEGVLTDLNIALNGLIFTPTLNYVGETYLQLEANDLGNSGLPGPLTATATITLSVILPNTPPIALVPGQQVITEDMALVFAVTKSNVITVNDAEVGMNPMSVSLSVMSGTLSLSQLSGLTFTVGDGITDTAMTFMGMITDLNTALNGLVFSPTLNASGLTNLTVIANDLGQIGPPGPLSVTQTVVISITPINDAPIVTPTIFTATEDTPLITQVVGYDPDGDPLTYQAATFPTGNLYLVSNGQFTYTPPVNSVSTDSFTYRANDGQYDSNTATISITVVATNDTPVFVSTPILTTYTNITYSYYITTNDIDGDPITLSAPTLPSWLTLVDNGDGTGVLTGTAPCGIPLGSYSVTLEVSDSISNSVQSFDVNLTNSLMVDNTSDINDGDIATGNLTIREAILYACPNDTITFAPALTGSTITLSTGQLDVTKNMGITSTVPITISGNNASRVFNVSGGLSNVVLDGLNIFNGNAGGQSAGGLMNAGANTVTINNSTFFYNHGIGSGAIQSWSGTLIINNSTFYSNSTLGAFNGGALDVASSVTINNSTFVDNIALDSGGAIAVASGSLTIKNSTFSGNSSANGGHTLTIYGGAINLYNTIMANGSGGSGECSGTLSTNTNNLIEDGSCGAAFTGDPQLGPLQNNGGTTMSMALLTGSPAANAGDNATCLTTDQRGIARPTGTICDIGAYEANLPPIAGHFNGLNLDGVNNYIQLPANGALNFNGGSNLSVEMWIKTTGTSIGLFNKPGLTPGNVQYTFWINATGMLELGMDQNNMAGWMLINSTTAVNTGVWTHVAFTKSGCNISFYVNGVAAGSGIMGGAQCGAGSSGNQGNFFASIFGTYFNGQADELRLWNVARSQAQIQANMGRTLMGDESGLLGYWRLEEGSGTTANDTTANGLHGALQNFVAADWFKSTETVGPAWRILNTVTLNNTLPSYEPEGQSVTYSIVANGTQGVATLTNASTGAFTYVPNPGAAGTDTFTYKVNDGISDSNIATASIDMTSLVVSSLGDTDDGNFSLGQNTLREAITYAPAGSTITFDPVITGGTITLGSQLTINKDLTINSSIPITISGNNAVRVFDIGASATNLIIDGLTIANGVGDGAGMYINSPNNNVTINNSTFTNNNATTNGGGLINGAGIITVNNSTFANNNATWGGGIWNGGTATINNSTFISNSVSMGGGGLLSNSGNMTINNSTLAYNNAASRGGGVFNNVGTVTVNNSTLSNNSSGTGGGIANWSGTINLKNTIIANSPSGGDCYNGATLGTNTNNLIEDNSCSPILAVDPLLGALQNNGGTTMTMAPSVCSAVINAAGAGATTSDQINQAVFGGTRDIGAFEIQYGAGGSPITVLNTNDSGAGSLREAICMVTAGGTINFTPALSGSTITLSSGQLSINKDLTISGTVPISISGNNSTRVFLVTAGNVTFDTLTIMNGNAATSPVSTGFGGGINIQAGTVIVNNSTLKGNSSTQEGAGINSYGTSVTINNSTFTNNSAGTFGGGILIYNGLTVNNSTFYNNTAVNGGGAIAFNIGTININNSTLDSNSNTLYAANGAILNLKNSILSNNSGTMCDIFGSGSGLGTVNNNLIQEASASSCGITDGVNGNKVGLAYDSQLGALQNNGGTTMTMVPSICSPVINAAGAGATTSDQINQAVFGGTRDMGAFELQFAAGGSPITVLNTNDSGVGSLREAICMVTAGGTINFAAGLSGQTITLASQLLINKSVAITGNVPINISGNNSSRVFYVGTGAANVIFDGLTIANGSVTGTNGGGMYINSAANTVTINNSTFTGNSASLAVNLNGGGGLYNNGGTVTINDSTFANNTGHYDGGGLINNGGIMLINRTTFATNTSSWHGGAVVNNINSNMTINNSTFKGNSTTTWEGGAIINSYDGTANLTINNSTLANNSSAGAGGGINNMGGTLNLRNSIIANNINGDCVNSGTIATNTSNLIKDGSCTPALTGDPLLGPLQNNGGSTMTMAPSACSPVVNASGASATPSDQTGQAAIGTRDIGAFENRATGTGLAATTVQNTADSGGGSLREAITCIIASGGTITFNPALSGQTITLAGTEIPINLNMTIDATGNPVTVSGANASRVFTVATGVNLTMNNLTISNGNSGALAGAGLDTGINSIIVLNNCTFSNNQASTGSGGAIRLKLNANVTINNCIFNNNTAGVAGGAIVVNFIPAALTVNDSTFNNNSAVAASGAIHVGSACCSNNINIYRSLFNGNSVTNGASGVGGVINVNNGTANIVNSTMINNTSAWKGGAVAIGSVATINLYNVTLSGNTATSGSNHSYQGNGTFNAYNTIFAGGANTQCDYVVGTTGGSNNLVQGGDGDCPAATQTGSPALGALAANGGPTQTMIPGGSAIGTGLFATCNAAPVSGIDQRGFTRGLSTCDIGAYDTNTTNRPAPIELQQIYLPLLLKK